MNSTLKIILPLGALMAVVFIATLVSQNVGDHTTPDDSPRDVINGPPLYFMQEGIAYDPTSEDIALRNFQGFYEPGGPKVLVPFWFKNPHPVPVKITVLGRSCVACSTIRIVTFTPEANRLFGQRLAASSLPASALGVPSLITALSTAALIESAKKEDFTFQSPDEAITVPAAPSPDTPLWGMLILGVDVVATGRKELRADLTLTAGNSPTVTKAFGVGTIGFPPFEVVPKTIKFDDLPEDAEPQTKEFYYWSTTRGMPVEGRDGWPVLPPPNLVLNGTDPFVKVGTPIPLSDAELARSPLQQGPGGAPLRVRGAYRVPVTVTRKLPGASPGTAIEPDIGPYERTIGITMPGTLEAQSVKVQTNITGLVSLLGAAQSIDMKSFPSDLGSRVTGTLVTDRKDIIIEPLPAEFKPSYLSVTLKDKIEAAGRIHWPFEVEIKPNLLAGELHQESIIVFKITTPTGVRKARIPVKGRSFNR